MEICDQDTLIRDVYRPGAQMLRERLSINNCGCHRSMADVRRIPGTRWGASGRLGNFSSM